ncbi:MAG: beta-galactosidase [Lewinellaceae bacterium]|nr:beta-galactosidase [Lewinellaceae bacterium]
MKNIQTFFLAVFLFFLSNTIFSQRTYEIDLNVPEMSIRSGHLNLGGKGPNGEEISVNNYFVSLNGRPFIPVAGEFHFSRYPKQYWDESLKKMKAGGINVVATYVFWNIHEEKQGQFNWSGNRDLANFIRLCAKNGLFAIVRIGPFCHGEIRSGGIPDWVLGSPVIIRSNDPGYLEMVDQLYTEIGKQIQGLYFKDGGPIIGIQLENEFQHSAAPWGLTYPGQPHDWTASEQDLGITQQGVGVARTENPYATLGSDHMEVLKSLAKKAGLDVPLYTATGWGNAAIVVNGSIPVTALYAYPFWTEKKDLSPFFLYKNMHSSPDYAPVSYVAEDYPSFAAELGSGIMSVYSRRPIVEQKSLDAMINRCLGSGANGLGYYMYHGGSTPRGEQYFFADEAYGLPKVSYDFQAPVGEFGQLREGYHRLKLVHWFISDFGDLLAPMAIVLPENANTLTQENQDELRYSVRAKDGSGFLFLNNFQDDAVMPDKTGIQFRVKSSRGDLIIPETGSFDLKSGENAIFPFHFDMNGVHLNYATAQLMMKGDHPASPYYAFFVPEGVKPEFSFASKKGLKIQNEAGCIIEENKSRWLVKCRENGPSEFRVIFGKNTIKVLVVDKAMALKAWLVSVGEGEHLFFTDATVLQWEKGFSMHSMGQETCLLDIYPKLGEQASIDCSADELVKMPGKTIFSSFRVSWNKVEVPLQTYAIGERKLVVHLPKEIPSGLNDLFLSLDYVGDTAMGFLDGDLVADEFYKGIPWKIGLRRFYPEAGDKDLVFYLRPLYKNATFLPDLDPADVPDFGKQDQVLTVRGVGFVAEYGCWVSIEE